MRNAFAFAVVLGVVIFGLALRQAAPHALPPCSAFPDIFHECNPSGRL